MFQKKTTRRLVTGVFGTFALMLGLIVGIVHVQAASTPTPWRYDCTLKAGVTTPTGDPTKDLTCKYVSGNAAATPPASDVVTSIYPSSQGDGQVKRVHVGMNEWMGTQITLPSPVPDGQWLLLHGDVQGTGDCVVAVFGPGETPGTTSDGFTISQATWQAYLLKGGTDQEKADVAVKYIAQVAARETDGDCPVVRAPQGIDLGQGTGA